MALSQLIRIPVTRNPNFVANGTRSLLATMHKYDITPTMEGRYHRDQARNLVYRRDDGTTTPIPTEDISNDLFYSSEVTIGTPGQKFSLIFDSGSADLWIWSTLLPASILATGRKLGTAIFDPDQSSTYTDIPGAKWRIRYGDGSSAGGKVGKDNLKIGNIMIGGQGIELADRMSNTLATQSDTHGLLGLAFSSINTVTPDPINTPLENMIAQQDIPPEQSLFTAYLGSYKDVNDPDRGQSFFTFGGIDQSVVEASRQEITYVPVDNSRGFWEIPTPSYYVNGNLHPTAGNTAIADTGTTLMLVSDAVCTSIYSTIPGAMYSQEAQGWIFPESTLAKDFPVVSYTFGDKQIIIEKENINYARVNSFPGMVYGGFQSRGTLHFDIWGDTFLKSVYAVFDAGNMRFGVVQRADPAPDSTNMDPKAA